MVCRNICLFLPKKTYIMTQFENSIVILKNYFKEQIILTLYDLALLLNTSIRTVQRKLIQLDTIKSYNHNGRYFALKEVAQFNSYGIWEYNEVHFSKFGNLKNTLIQIIRNSETGLNALEISKILGLETRSFLYHYKDITEIKREKTNGCYVYFSSEHTQYNFQLTNRINLKQQQLVSPIKDSAGIIVLVETVKHPEYSTEKLSKHLRRQGVRIKPATITAFFKFHGIEKKTNSEL